MQEYNNQEVNNNTNSKSVYILKKSIEHYYIRCLSSTNNLFKSLFIF